LLLDMGDPAGLGFAEIDPTRTEAARARVPVLRHRRAIPSVEAL
jgi:predicted amidohydrolase